MTNQMWTLRRGRRPNLSRASSRPVAPSREPKISLNTPDHNLQHEDEEYCPALQQQGYAEQQGTAGSRVGARMEMRAGGRAGSCSHTMQSTQPQSSVLSQRSSVGRCLIAMYKSRRTKQGKKVWHENVELKLCMRMAIGKQSLPHALCVRPRPPHA